MNKIQQEFDVVAPPSSTNKKLNLFKFHRDDKFPWKDVKIRRDLDGKQPLAVRVGSGKAARRFKAVREGGVSENASYYVFIKTLDKNQREVFEVHPVNDWYKCSATQRYKVLNANEAELMYEKRHKIFNQFSVMPQRSNEDGEDGKASKSFKVSELDEWGDSDGFDGDSEADGEGDGDSKAKLKAKLKRKKNAERQEKDDNSEPGEESDEGDFDDREVDYMSDTSSSDESMNSDKDDKTDVKAISEETGLRDLLRSDDEDEGADDSMNSNEDSRDRKVSVENEENGVAASGASNLKRKGTAESDLSGLDSDSNGDDIDVFGSNSQLHGQSTVQGQQQIASQSIPKPGVNSLKRKHPSEDDDGGLGISGSSAAGMPPAARRPHLPVDIGSGTSGGINNSYGLGSGQDMILEDIIKKYLMRKPITVKQLIKGVKGKLKALGQEFDTAKTGAIIRKLKPEQTKGQSETYLYLRP